MNGEPNNNKRVQSRTQYQSSSGRINKAQIVRRPASAPTRVRRATDINRNTALTDRQQRSLAIQRRKDRKWEAGIQRVRQGVDRPLLIFIIVLLCLGTVMVFSASYPSALASSETNHDGTFYIKKQLLWLLLGSVAMTACAICPYKLYKKATLAIAGITILFLIIVLFKGSGSGVKRWLYIGSISIQVSEVAKIALIITLAWYIDKHVNSLSQKPKHTKLNNLALSFFSPATVTKLREAWITLIAPGLILATFCGLVLLEKHLSATLILAAIGACIIFLSGVNLVKMIVCYGTLGGIAVGAYLAKNAYALKRITSHADENVDILKEGWQTAQGLNAIGNGGPFGVGLGYSDLKHNYVSEAHNDFIFTIWCEELGLVGAVLLIILYGLFVWRGITVARRAPDTFSSLVAFGITCQIGIQAALNMLVVTALIPNTGISLPFFSYGGSSLILLMAEMGILLSVSKHSFQKK